MEKPTKITFTRLMSFGQLNVHGKHFKGHYINSTLSVFPGITSLSCLREGRFFFNVVFTGKNIHYCVTAFHMFHLQRETCWCHRLHLLHVIQYAYSYK